MFVGPYQRRNEMWTESSCRRLPGSPERTADAWACSKVSVNLLKSPSALQGLRSKLDDLRTSRAFPGLAEALGLKPPSSSCRSLPEEDTSSVASGGASKKRLLELVGLMMDRQLKKGLPAEAYVSSDEEEWGAEDGEEEEEDDEEEDEEDEEEDDEDEDEEDEDEDEDEEDEDEEDEDEDDEEDEDEDEDEEDEEEDDEDEDDEEDEDEDQIRPEEIAFDDFITSPSESGGGSEEEDMYVVEEAAGPSSPFEKGSGGLTDVADVDPGVLQKALKARKPTFPLRRRE
jgi:hypothetical protein